MPSFLLANLGRMVEPPVTEGLKRFPLAVEPKVAVVGAGLSEMIAASDPVKLGY